MNEIEMRVLADKLARALFMLGDEPKSPCNRIAFMGGDWPETERPQGGLVESSLSKMLFRIIAEHHSTPKAKVNDE